MINLDPKFMPEFGRFLRSNVKLFMLVVFVLPFYFLYKRVIYQGNEMKNMLKLSLLVAGFFLLAIVNTGCADKSLDLSPPSMDVNLEMDRNSLIERLFSKNNNSGDPITNGAS